MKVYLLSYTKNCEKVVGAAAHSCYSFKTASELINTMSYEKIKKIIDFCIERGHLSVIEHANFTFSIEGLSRVSTHQLVRHRLASYSQQSQRYVKFKEDRLDFVIPSSIKKDKQLYKDYLNILDKSKNFYLTALDKGIKAEDARYIIPSGVKSNIVVTMNARELLHFFALRCCIRAQWEIRTAAWKMLNLVKRLCPLIFEKAGPSCFKGFCPEKDDLCFKKMAKAFSLKVKVG